MVVVPDSVPSKVFARPLAEGASVPAIDCPLRTTPNAGSRIRFARREVFRSDFAAEWIGIAIVALFALFWAHGIRFGLAVKWDDFLLPVLAVLAIVSARLLRSERGSLAAEYFLLTIMATAAFGVISYLSMTTDRPLADTALMAADRAIGFDWHANYGWLVHHPAIAKILQVAYNSLVYQGLYFGVLFGLMARRRELREMFWLVAAAGVMTSAGAALFPAFGPYKAFGINTEFLSAMKQLRGPNLHFALASLTGVVSFPSFHTTMALLYMVGFRRTGAIGWAAVALNVVMLPAIPFFGGHYLVDMFAGALVALASLTIVKAWPVIAGRIRSGDRPPVSSWEPVPNQVPVFRQHGLDRELPV
ncbi:MAG TPA: phosphatase PAP2 family protein [Rhizomicrobium sp.]|jgi:hypothetical protein|nr:phosphatase PAP2 family protein [Rhizomicrobium sp.]